MKQKFSKKWAKSKQPRKKRKYIANAPKHIKRKFLSSNLNQQLRKKYNKRNINLRKGDKVKIMVGKYKGKQGKINNINLRKTKVSVEGVQRQKKDGTKVNVYFHPSNLQIQELNLDDKERLKKIERKIQEIKRQNKNDEKKIEKENKAKDKERKNASEKK